MANKKDSYWFDGFLQCARIATQAARTLYEILGRFDPRRLDEQLERLHGIEHNGDDVKHDLTGELARAFITPIERDDILQLSQNIDDVTDGIEDVLIHIYVNNITVMRADALPFAQNVVRCCEAMEHLLAELPNFRRSSTLTDLVVELNRLEEEGDRLYIQAMRRLHIESKDPVEIIVWREIYEYLEQCCDRCEHVADVIAGIAIDNA